jgi:hypothetical protein
MLNLTKIVQHFPKQHIEAIERVVGTALEPHSAKIRKGGSIAIAAGSRGIFGIDRMVKAAVSWLKEIGAHPFIVPAMGSHGGATAEGQREVLAGYGISEASMGAPIRSSLEVIELDAADLPVQLYMDAHAWESDGIILINRIKPHTDYSGPYESGLVKMSVIGLGKHAQALEVHRHGVPGLRDIMPRCAEKILSTGKILLGLGVIENAYDRPAQILALEPERFMSDEPALLERSRAALPCFPVEDLDLLIVDNIGKDISGVGMDPNIIGRLYIHGEADPEIPRIKAILARDLTPNSHGNALGVGLADVITRTLFDKIDFDQMNENASTSTFLERAKIPIIANNDGQALDYALRALGSLESGRERVIRIRDTLSLHQIYVSPAVLDAATGTERVEVTKQSIPLLDEQGKFPDQGVWD